MMGSNNIYIERGNDEVTQLRAKLQEVDALWRATFDEAAVGMVHMALDCGWIRVNQHFCAMLGYRVDELLVKTIQEITHPNDWPDNAVGMQQLALGEIQSYITNKRYVHRNGTLIWGRLTLRLTRTGEGSPDYFVAVIEDITALKQAADALRVSEERHRHIIEAQVDPICRFGVDYRLTFVNEPYATLYGKQPTALLGKSMLDIVPPAYHDAIATHLSALSKEHPVLVTENPAYLADGLLHWFQWSNRRIELPNGTIEYQGVGRDITDLKQAEEAERQQKHIAEAMRDTLVALTSSLDVDQVMTQILASLATVVPNDASRIILLEGGYGRTAYTYGYSPEAVALLKEYSVAPIRLGDGSILDGKQAYFIADVHTTPNWMPPPPLAWIRSSMGVPITAGGEIIGLLIVNSATPSLYEPQDVEKLQTFAIYASLALNNAYQATALEQRVAERTAELQAAKEEVESILNHSSDAILLVKYDLHIVQSNAVFGKLFSTDVADYQGASLLAFVHPDDHVTVQDRIALVMREGGNHHLQIRICGKNDSYFDAELSISLLDDSGFVCTLRDITERKAHERQLLYYASLQESVNEAVIGVDLDYKIQSWNKAAETIFGWRTAEVIGQTTGILCTLYSGTDSPQTAWRTLFEQGYWQGSVIQHRKDGTPRNIFASVTLLLDEQRVPFGMVAVSRDITEQKQTEMALKESRYFTKRIVDTAPNIIYVYDLLTQRHTYLNNNIVNMLGYSVEEFSHMGERILSEVVHPEDLGRFFAHRTQLLAGKDGEVFTIENRMRHKNGEWRWFLMQATIFQRTAEGAPSQILGVAIDINEEKQAEVALAQALQTEKELNEHKTRFITTTSHEFSTPLAVILTMTETLTAYRHKLPDEQIAQRLLKIKQQIQHLKRMLTDVLELEQMRTSQVSFTPTPLNPSVFFHELLADFQHAFSVTQRLVYHADPSIPLAKLDDNLLRKIVTNLLSNAVKYSTTDSMVTFTVAHTGKMLILQVQDEGIGIPAADMKHLYQPFYRASNVENIPGTGLGLSITKEAVELHGGTITVESELGVGTTATIQIPV